MAGKPIKKLTPREVAKIKSLLHKYTDKQLAAQFGVALSTVWHIRNKLTWAWVPAELAEVPSGGSTY